MGNIVYLTGFPGPAGTIDYPALRQFPIDVGADPVDLQSSRGMAYLLRALPADPDTAVTLAGPPFPAGMINYPDAFEVSWLGARTLIYPAASLGRSSASDDTPANTYVPGKLAGAVANYQTELFDGIDPVAQSKSGKGEITLIDPDGELDGLIDLAWDGAPLDILRGGPLAAYSTYEVVARLTTNGLLYDQRRKQFRLRDLGWQLEAAELHGQRYGGTGGTDGDAAIAGQEKPYAVGAVFNCEPTRINAILEIFQVSCSSILAVDAARDGGVALAFAADHGDYAALSGATVAPATFATCLALGLIRLGSPVVFSLRVDLRGDNDTIDGQTYPSTRGQIARRIATGRGTIKLINEQIDFATLNRMEAEQPGVVGYYWNGGSPAVSPLIRNANEPSTISKASALTEVMAGCLGWWAVRPNGLLALGFMDEPAGAPVLTLHYPEDFAGEPEMLSTYLAPRRATYVGWARNYGPQDPSQLALSVDPSAALIYAADQRLASSVDGFLPSMWPTAAASVVNGNFRDEANATAEAERQQRVMGVRRERWAIPVACDPFADLLGKVAQVNGFTRYGWGGARKFICVGMSFASGRAVTLQLWG